MKENLAPYHIIAMLRTNNLNNFTWILGLVPIESHSRCGRHLCVILFGR